MLSSAKGTARLDVGCGLETAYGTTPLFLGLLLSVEMKTSGFRATKKPTITVPVEFIRYATNIISVDYRESIL